MSDFLDKAEDLVADHSEQVVESPDKPEDGIPPEEAPLTQFDQESP